jgi:hypothetical protein
LAQRQSKANKAALIVAQEPTQSLGLGGVEAKLQERVSGLDTQLAEYQKRHSALESSYSQLQERTLATQQAKPTPPPSLSDWGGLAAAAAIFAASASSRRPLVAGLTAGAAALEAQRANNQEGYAAALEGWYKNMNFALKQEELAGNAMKNILTATNTTTQQQIAALRALGTNENMQRRIATGDMRVIQQGFDQQQTMLAQLRRAGDTRFLELSKGISQKFAAGKLTSEQATAEYEKLRAAVDADQADPSSTQVRDYMQGAGPTPLKPSAAAATAEAQNTLARSVNDWYSSADSKRPGAKWKHPNTGVEYTRKQVQQAKESMPSTLPTDLADLARAMGSRPVAGTGASAAPAQLPRAQAEGAPAQPKTLEEYNALPKGAIFVDPEDGKTYRKP